MDEVKVLSRKLNGTSQLLAKFIRYCPAIQEDSALDGSIRDVLKPANDNAHWSAGLQLHCEPTTPERQATQFAHGIARGIVNEAAGFIDFLAKPNSVNDALISIGPQLDNAFNYYGNHFLKGTIDEISKDASTAARNIGDACNSLLKASPEKKGEAVGAVVFNLALTEVGVSVARTALFAEVPAALESRAVSISRGAVGKGGDWPVLNERPAPNVVRQSEPYSCACACGEMLSEGKLTEAQLMAKMMEPGYDGADMLSLADHLGPQWNKGRLTQGSLNGLLTRSPFAAELRDLAPTTGPYRRAGLGHTVVVDGVDEAGNIRVRDPQHGTRYEMIRSDFEKVWTGGAVWRR